MDLFLVPFTDVMTCHKIKTVSQRIWIIAHVSSTCNAINILLPQWTKLLNLNQELLVPFDRVSLCFYSLVHFTFSHSCLLKIWVKFIMRAQTDFEKASLNTSEYAWSMLFEIPLPSLQFFSSDFVIIDHWFHFTSIENFSYFSWSESKQHDTHIYWEIVRNISSCLYLLTKCMH